MEDSVCVKYEGELDKYSGVGVFKHKIKIWMSLDDFTITLCKFEKRSSCIGSINVYDIQITRKTGHKSGLEFEIITKTKTFVFIAPSKELATEWVKIIQKVMSLRTTASSVVVDPDRGRNRREQTNPVPDLPEYDRANKFGVTLKPSSRIINKTASTTNSISPQDIARPQLQRAESEPTEYEKKATNNLSIDSHFPQKPTVKPKVMPNVGLDINKTVVSQSLQPPSPCSPSQEEKPSMYLTAVNSEERATPKKTPKETPKDLDNVKTKVEYKENKEQITEIFDKECASFNNKEQTKQPEPNTTAETENATDTRKSERFVEKEERPKQKETPASDNDVGDDVSDVVMRRSQILHHDGSPVVMRKSSRSHISNQLSLADSSMAGESIAADSLYDDIAYKPVYPTRDSSDDDSDADYDEALLNAFDDVFEDKNETEPMQPKEDIQYKPRQDTISETDESRSGFLRLKEYLENNCQFHLETHTVTLVKPMEMLRNHLIK